MKDKRPPKSTTKSAAKSWGKRPSGRNSAAEEHPARARPAHKAQSQNDRRKTRQSGGGDAKPAHGEKPTRNAAAASRAPNKPAGAASASAKFPARRATRKAAPNPAPDKAPAPSMPPQRLAPRPAKKHSPANLQGAIWLYGRHAVAAALANPDRRIRRVFATKNAADWLMKSGASGASLATLEDTPPELIDDLLKEGAVHQGLAALVEPLQRKQLEDVCAPAEIGRLVLVLDQITDPQNIGALFRSAAAFGACAVIVQDRRTPPLSGALAKAAAGAIEKVPCIEVVNISRAIEELQSLGFFCAGLAGEAQTDIAALPAAPLALVMGAEGEGLRRLVGEKCDQLFRIPIQPGMESLNVSTAAAISLYEARRPR